MSQKYLLRLLSIVLIILVFQGKAQIPPGYYDPAAGKTGIALQSALHNIIKDHTVISYTSIPGFFLQTDAKPGNVVWDMYSDVPGGTPPYVYHYNMGQECGNYSGEGDCYNREHSWPQSWFNEALPMKSDMFHIYPTDGWVNGKRSNYPYGTVLSPAWTSLNGCKLGNCTWPGYNGTVFEPLDEYKGDFARSYFYMSTRYYTEDGSWNITDMTNKSQLKPWALQMMLHWSNADPVSVKETNRNNAVYNIQQNRNPFIDHPEYAAMIWGNPVGVDGIDNSSLQVILSPNPADDHCTITFPKGMDPNDFKIIMAATSGTRHTPPCTREGNNISMNLQDLSSGLYILTVSGESTTIHLKLIKR